MADKDIEQQKRQLIAQITQEANKAEKEIKLTAKESVSSVKDQTKESKKEIKTSTKDSIASIKEQTDDSNRRLKDHTKYAISEVNKRTKQAVDDIKDTSKETVDEIKDLTKDISVEADLQRKLLKDDYKDARKDIVTTGKQTTKSIKEVTNEIEKKLRQSSKDFEKQTKDAAKGIKTLSKESEKKLAEELDKTLKHVKDGIDTSKKDGDTGEAGKTTESLLDSILKEVVIIRKLVQGKKTTEEQQEKKKGLFADLKDKFAAKKAKVKEGIKGKIDSVKDLSSDATKMGSDILSKAGSIAESMGKIFKMASRFLPMISGVLLPAMVIGTAVAGFMQIAKDFKEKRSQRDELKALESKPPEEQTTEDKARIKELNDKGVHKSMGAAQRAAVKSYGERYDKQGKPNETPNIEPNAPQDQTKPAIAATTAIATGKQAVAVSQPSVSNAKPGVMGEKEATSFLKNQAGIAITPEGTFIDVFQKSAPMTEQQAKIRITDAGGDYDALMKVLKKNKPVEKPMVSAAAAPTSSPSGGGAESPASPESSGGSAPSVAPSSSGQSSSGGSPSPVASASPTMVQPNPSSGEDISASSQQVEQAQEQTPQNTVDTITNEQTATAKTPVAMTTIPPLFDDRSEFDKFENFFPSVITKETDAGF